jgi:hypothetical protein
MIASITRSASATPLPSRSAAARGHGRALALVAHLLGEQRLRALHGRVDEALLAVLQGHVEALVGGPGGDVAAHHAGADHVHVADAGITTAEALEAFGQEEDADQVARGRVLASFTTARRSASRRAWIGLPPLRCQVLISAYGAGTGPSSPCVRPA